MVFDSRSPQVAHGGLTQEFVGQTIEVKKPLFNSGIVTLMDFRCDQSQGVHFIYILPFSSTNALVESTRLVKLFVPENFTKKKSKHI